MTFPAPPAPPSIDTAWAPLGTLGRLQEVIDFWTARGAAFVPLPWLVPPAYLNATRPAHASGLAFMLGPEGLVASGEQAFLWLDEAGRLPSTPSVFIGWTPCFREEPAFDALHQRAFVKVELYAPVSENEPGSHALARILAESKESFAALCPEVAAALETVPQADGSWDIELAGVEVGSYGVRSRPGGGEYVYGTALAEPRWSTAVARVRAAQNNG